jgi:hypothetical protein
MGAKEIDGRFPPAKAEYDLVVRIGVSLEARPHALGV